jgi:hypothetical protein
VEFDRYVRSMIAAEVSSFKIRWVALHIRKRASRCRKAGRELSAVEELPKQGAWVSSLDWDRIHPSPGLYWLSSSEQKLYVGETLNLQQRFRLQFDTRGFDFWDTARDALEVRYRELGDVADALLKGNQSQWIARWRPLGNYSGFAAAL